jgi:hypothetical protein
LASLRAPTSPPSGRQTSGSAPPGRRR